ncbi:hypothetical protein SLE2022_195420 [Rubroshorea leprosula]
MEKQGEKVRQQRLVIVVYPFQGHISPMLQLGTILHSKGFSITVVHPEFNSPNPSKHPEFTFVAIPDKLLESKVSAGDFPGIALALNRNCAAPFQNCMEQILLEKDPGENIAGIIYDTLMYFAQSVADHFKVLGISARTSAAATILAFSVFPRLHGEGYISFQDSISDGGSQDLQSIKIKQLLTSLAENPTNSALELRAALTRETKKASAIIVNTMDFLEQEALAKIKEHFPASIFTIGPFHKLAPPISTSLLNEDSSCVSWLNKQAPKSVVYVSFGSQATIDEEELVNMAWGLAHSEQPFLWVVRPCSVRGFEWIESLPETYHERVGERGCFVRWAPQKEVLAHSAVGAFWSHCGWNSTLESICEGVPLLCTPFFGDQILDSRYICNVWKVGLEVEKGKIAEGIRRLMKDEEGMEIRKRAMDLKEKTEACLREGGSTITSLNEFSKQLYR